MVRALAWRNWERLEAVLWGILAFFLHMPLLSGSFWLDEAAQALESARPWHQQLELAADFQPPLYHLWVALWSLGGAQEWWLRLSSVMPNVGTVLIVWLWARSFGKRAARSAAILTVSSSLFIFYGQELRPYAFMTFWVVLSSWLIWNVFLQAKATSHHQWQYWLIPVTTALAGLSSYTALFFWPAAVVAAVLSRFHWKRTHILLSLLLVAGVWWLVWWPGFWQQWQAGQALRGVLGGWDRIVSPPALKAMALVGVKLWYGVRAIDFTWQHGVTVLLLWGSWLFLGWQWWRQAQASLDERRLTIFLIALIGVALLGVWIVTLWTPILAPKRVLYVWPWLALVTGVWAARTRWSHWLFVGLVVWQFLGVGAYWASPDLQRENWRSVVTLVESRSTTDQAVVIMAFDAPFAPWRWYQRIAPPVRTTGLVPLHTAEEASERVGSLEGVRQVWLFAYLTDLTDPNHVLPSVLEQRGYKESAFWLFPGIGRVTLYEIQPLFASL